MFYAKPDYGYAYNSTEGTANIKAVYDYLSPEGYTKNCVIGILGNVAEESGFNPWYWQNHNADPSDPNIGYGLFQFTPASQYINATWLPDHAPNMSTTQTTAGASPNDAKAQLYAVINDVFNKWAGNCWRSYWDPNDYPYLYNLRGHILSSYGSGSSITMNQFKVIDNIEDALFCFFACYEGPGNPIDTKFATRMNYAAQVKTILDNYSGLPDILIMKKIIDRNFGRSI